MEIIFLYLLCASSSRQLCRMLNKQVAKCGLLLISSEWSLSFDESSLAFS